MLLRDLNSQETLPIIDLDVWTNDDPDSIHLLGDDREESTSDDDMYEEIPTKKISQIDAIKSLNVAITWAVENNMDFADILSLRKMREKAVLMNAKSSTQQKITTYFS